MSLRPGENNPGRTYKWYNGTAIYEFGYGMHYTNFTASPSGSLSSSNFSIAQLTSNCSETYKDRCPFQSFRFDITNTGSRASDYSALGFLAGQFGPQPYPKKSLVKYQRLFGITPGSTQTATLDLTLGSLARVDEKGNTVLYPGDYSLMVDTQPLTYVNFTLSGSPYTLDNWPQPPTAGHQESEYFVGGFGTEPVEQSLQSPNSRQGS